MKPIGTDDCHSFTADRVTRENAAVRGVYTKICCRGSAAFMPGAPFRALFSGLFACARAQVGPHGCRLPRINIEKCRPPEKGVSRRATLPPPPRTEPPCRSGWGSPDGVSPLSLSLSLGFLSVLAPFLLSAACAETRIVHYAYQRTEQRG